MRRRRRARQPIGSPSMSYGITVFMVAGLALVDSFAPNVRTQVSPNHGRTREHRHARSGFRASTFTGHGCHHTCRTSPRGNSSSSSDSSSKGGGHPPCSPSIRKDSVTSASSSKRKRVSRTSNANAPLPRGTAKPLGNTEVTRGRLGKPQQLRQERSSGGKVLQGLGDKALSRGELVGAFAALGAAALVVGGSSVANAATATEVLRGTGWEDLDEIIVWSPRSEIMKRSPAASGSIAPGFNETYPVRFVTYLARYLLNYDKASRELWEQKASFIPINFSEMEVEAVRRDQFAEFAKAVQVGLLDYQGPQGVRSFFSLMRFRYGQGEDCKRQLAILFSFLEEGQPTEQIEGLLGEIDNGQISSLVMTDPGGGYTGLIPKVMMSASQTGRRARARAVLKETGHLVGIRLPDCEYSRTYDTPPKVRVSAPDDPSGVQAEARVVLDKRKGFITEVEITNPGSGYSSTFQPVTVEVFGQDNSDETGDSLVESVLGPGAVDALGSAACQSNFIAEAIIDREVGSIVIEDSGDGYATSVPLTVEIQSPAECQGRPGGTQAFAVGLVSTGPSRDNSRSKLPVPGTSVTSKLAQILPSTVADTLTINENGRYESLDLIDLPTSKGEGKKGGGTASFDPVFGPVGRSPLEKESVLGMEDYLKLATAGAACNALVRFFLHPLDCVKTTVQAEMGKDVTVLEAAGGEEGLAGEVVDAGWTGTVKGILKKGGVAELLRGIDVSTILGFILGFIGFGGTEFFRRELERMMEGAPSNPVWIILLASALAQCVSCVVTCPVEAVRIRVMTCDKRPEFLSFVGTAQEMLDERGLAYFWSGLPALLFRELPFAIAKFLTFELVRDKIFEEIPAAQESVFYALVVSIVAGMTAGVAGAVVSQPADTVLTRMNTTQKPAPPATPPQLAPAPAARRPWDLRRSVGPSVAGAVGVRAGISGGTGVFRVGRGGPVGLLEKEVGEEAGVAGEEDKSMMDWKDVVRDMFEGDGGAGNLFSGLGLRAVFFGAAIALQFFAFDYFKALLKVSPDDLQLVLDVFADRVSFYGGTGQ